MSLGLAFATHFLHDFSMKMFSHVETGTSQNNAKRPGGTHKQFQMSEIQLKK